MNKLPDENNFVVYNKIAYHNKYMIYNYNEETYDVTDKIPYDINNFYLTKKYSITHEEKQKLTHEEYTKLLEIKLQQYAVKLYSDRNELLHSTVLRKEFDYFEKFVGIQINYQNHAKNIYRMFLKLTSYKLNEIPKITKRERYYIESTQNCGLTYLREKGKFQCYGYDFSMNYPNMMCDMNIPVNEGKEYKITDLPETLQYGFYKVKITSTDDDFCSIFRFNDNSIYTHYDVEFAMSIAQKNKDKDISISLIDDEYNCYLYDDEDIVRGSKIFYPWLKVMKQLKKEMPKNDLIKMLSSFIWGHLCQCNVINVTEDDLLEGDYDFSTDDDCKYQIIDVINKKNYKLFKLIDHDKQYYKTNLRLKSFLTSYGRVKITNIAIPYMNDVLRICTDGIVFTKDHRINVDGFINEAKTTGKIKWSNINTYKKIS